MPDYQISNRARARLLDIYGHTEEAFGRYQADAYHAGFESTFQLLAKFPGIGRAADEIRTGFRRYTFQSHYIFFTDENGHIVIRDIIHSAQKLRPELFE